MIGMGMEYSTTLAMIPNHQRLPGVYHNMSKEEYDNFRGHLESITRAWHIDCLNNSLSAGFMVGMTGESVVKCHY